MKNPRLSPLGQRISPMAMLEAIGSKDDEEALVDLVAAYDMLARVGSASEDEALYNQWANQWAALTEQRGEGKKVTAKDAREL